MLNCSDLNTLKKIQIMWQWLTIKSDSFLHHFKNIPTYSSLQQFLFTNLLKRCLLSPNVSHKKTIYCFSFYVGPWNQGNTAKVRLTNRQQGYKHMANNGRGIWVKGQPAPSAQGRSSWLRVPRTDPVPSSAELDKMLVWSETESEQRNKDVYTHRVNGGKSVHSCYAH